MNVRRRLAAVAGAGLTLALVATGCSKSSSDDATSGPVTITFAWWGDDTRAKATQAAIDLFTAAHPDITVQTEYEAFGAYGTKLATEVGGGNAPDLFQIDRSYQAKYASQGVLADLKQYSTADLSGIDPNFLASGQYNGAQIAVPFGQTTQILVVDTTELDKLGVAKPAANWNWDQLASWAQQVADASGGSVAGLADPGGTWGAFETWQYQHGKQLYTADGKVGFTQQDLEDFWNFTLGLSKTGAATKATVTATIDGVPADEPVAKGAAVAEWDYDSVFASYVGATTDTLEIVPLPAVNGKTGMYARPSMLLSVSAKSSHASAAAQLLSFLVNDPGAAAALGTGRGLFPNLSVRATLASSATGPTKQVYDLQSSVQSSLIPTPAAPPAGDSDLLAAITRLYQGVTSGQQSVHDAAGAFMDQVETSIES